MSIPTALTIVAAAVSLLTASAGPATAPSTAETTAAPEFSVQILNSNGSGCPASSETKVTADVRAGGAVTLRYPNFTVSGSDYATCVVILSVTAPEGWTYAIPSIDNLAWLELGDSGYARLQTNAWYTGYPWTVSDDKRVYGPLYNFWETVSTPEEMLWAPCGASVNLSVAETLRVNGVPSDSASLLSTTILRPTWRQC